MSRRSRAKGPRVLVLGGSTEGFDAADALVAAGYEVVTSFAGRTATRRTPAGFARVGGFGGASGMAVYLTIEDIAVVVDATHPFANKIKTNAEIACREAGTPLIHIERPPWTPQPGDDWRVVPNLRAAAEAIPGGERPCFLTIGRQEIRHFAGRTDIELVIRTIDPPETPFDHPRASFIFDRGPFEIEAERALFAERRFGSLVTKNSGSDAAAAKLTVARDLGIPVVMVERARRPEGVAVASVDEAAAAVAALLGSAAA
ncbi:cobalt-precorrin-6A reductase [Hansschlegelia sp. KR7-227]|uniref:cobalt-precorrin-6A reductase n=1 Tax=Hansschlegelia sp. KR7-227 TaxID=3400914 RepID=UPI003BFD5E9E